MNRFATVVFTVMLAGCASDPQPSVYYPPLTCDGVKCPEGTYCVVRGPVEIPGGTTTWTECVTVTAH